MPYVNDTIIKQNMENVKYSYIYSKYYSKYLPYIKYSVSRYATTVLYQHIYHRSPY